MKKIFALVATLPVAMLATAAFFTPAWGWRIAFILVAILCALSAWIIANLDDKNEVQITAITSISGALYATLVLVAYLLFEEPTSKMKLLALAAEAQLILTPYGGLKDTAQRSFKTLWCGLAVFGVIVLWCGGKNMPEMMTTILFWEIGLSFVSLLGCGLSLAIYVFKETWSKLEKVISAIMVPVLSGAIIAILLFLISSIG